MTTTTLSSNQRFGKLLGGMLRKNVPAALYIFVLLFLFFPLQMVLETRRALEEIARAQSQLAVIGSAFWQDIQGPAGIYTQVSGAMVCLILMAGTLIIGLMQCGYLHNRRSVDLFHSLPVTRTQLMCAGTLSSFLTIMVPFLLNFVLNLGVCVYRVRVLGQYATVGLQWGELFWDILGWMTAVFAVLALIDLVATQVGSVFEHCVYTCELLCAPLLILLMNPILFENFLVGYTANFDTGAISSVSPALFMLRWLGADAATLPMRLITILWLLFGIAAFGVALLLYRRRRSELAETSGCRGFLGVFFTALIVYLGAPLVGAIVLSSWGSNNNVVYVLGVLGGSVLCYLLAAAVFNRGFAGLRRQWPSGLGICAFVTAVSVVLVTGGFGYEGRIPKAGQVKSVQIDFRGWYDYVEEINPDNQIVKRNGSGSSVSYGPEYSAKLSDPASIELIRQIHAELVAISKSEKEEDLWLSTTFRYQLQGSGMQRSYHKASKHSLALLNQLEDTEAFQQASNPLLRIDAGTVQRVELYNNLGFRSGELVTPSEIAALIEALRADSLARRTAPFVEREKVACYLLIETPYLWGSSYRLDVPNGGYFLPKSVYYNTFSVPVFTSYSKTLAQLGSNLPAPGTAQEVTGMTMGEFNSQFSGDSHSRRFVSTVWSPRQRDKQLGAAGFSGDRTTDQERISLAIEKQVNAVVSPDNDRQGQLYVTFYKGAEAGITVMLPLAELPSDYLADYPELYQQLTYDDSVPATTVAIPQAQLTA